MCPQRKAEFILSNSTDKKEYARAVREVRAWGLDPLRCLDELLKRVDVQASRTLEPSLRREIQLREKDWPILAGAVAADATHLITGDLRDFGAFMGGSLLEVLVLTPAQYLSSRARKR